jgi:hypothetical protein
MTHRQQYLLRAAELSAKAQTESAGADKFEFENLARAYLRLAQQAERNLAAIVCEKSPGKSQEQAATAFARKADGDKE